MKKALYVEDDRINSLVLQTMFRDHLEVDLAAESGEALEKLQAEQYELILLDINLGPSEMDGVRLREVIRTMRGYEHTPIFAVTAYALPGDEERFLAEGFDRYIAKPVRRELLLQAVAEVIGLGERES